MARGSASQSGSAGGRRLRRRKRARSGPGASGEDGLAESERLQLGHASRTAVIALRRTAKQPRPQHPINRSRQRQRMSDALCHEVPLGCRVLGAPGPKPRRLASAFRALRQRSNGAPHDRRQASATAAGFRLGFRRTSRPADVVPRYGFMAGGPRDASAGRPGAVAPDLTADAPARVPNAGAGVSACGTRRDLRPRRG